MLKLFSYETNRSVKQQCAVNSPFGYFLPTLRLLAIGKARGEFFSNSLDVGRNTLAQSIQLIGTPIRFTFVFVHVLFMLNFPLLCRICRRLRNRKMWMRSRIENGSMLLRKLFVVSVIFSAFLEEHFRILLSVFFFTYEWFRENDLRNDLRYS